MSPPAPRINTFMKVTNKPVIDSVSKIYIIVELMLGTNRLPLLGVTKKIYNVPMCGITFIICMALLWVTFKFWAMDLFAFMKIGDSLRYIICNILAFVLNSRLTKFYLELKKINEDVGFDTKAYGNRIYMLNYFMMFFTALLFFLSFYNFSFGEFGRALMLLLLSKIFNYIELNYYGHLFNIVIPKIRLVNNFIKLSYPFNEDRENLVTSHTDKELNDLRKNIKNHKSYSDMGQIMKLYQRIVQTYNSLYEAIKWQMLTCIICSFINLLVLIYKLITLIINKNIEYNTWMTVLQILIELIPLSTPCILADQINREVRELNDLLTSQLHEKNLDKSSRSTARALLTLMKTHDLSFTLFHMFDIDLTLPIKFCALLLTYVIIMMQFNKVLNKPNV